MPLLQGKSERSFKKNVETEMKAGKPQDQSLAIAYSVKRKNKKKMAQGGKVEISASDESRPMPEQEHADKKQDSKVHQKPLKMSQMTDDPSASQVSSRKSPAPSSAAPTSFDSEKHVSVDELTPEEMSMIHEHRKMMAMGGAVEHTDSTHVSDMEDEMENSRAKRQLDYEHSQEMLANGGLVSFRDAEDDDSPVDEIMQRRKMAAGGQVDLEANSEESPNNEDQMSYDAVKKEQYDLGQLDSQPDDSNEHGDDIHSDDHDMVEQIRKRIKSRRG